MKLARHSLVVVVVIALACLAQWALRRAHGGSRIAIAVGTAAVLAVLQGQLVATWAAVGLVAVDWGVRRRPPWPGVDVPPGGAEPVLLMSVPLALAVMRVGADSVDYGPSAAGIVVGVGTATVLWAVLRVGRGPWAAVGVACWLVLASGPAFAYPVLTGPTSVPEARCGPAVAAASLAMIALLSVGAGRRGPQGLNPSELAPYLLALPALVWSIVNVSLWTAGVLDGRGIGHRAWASAVSSFAPVLHDLVGRSGVPSLVLGTLFLGAAVLVEGRRARLLACAAVAASSTLGIAVGVVWQQRPIG